eukprot:TRINITY_DN1262_c0_g1_i3.p1 TRINITY_DN1262_c0_g1~~TRINITY_DN1262_c0_g1_i3.p1  ORF type:complete len:423 (-),score=53.28 TRINITY_DN1262_c0_g1_i3:54-1322(-)
MGATTSKFMIVTELVSTNLYSLIKKKEPLSLYLRVQMLKEAALALNWLHNSSPPIIHGGLTPFNFLVDNNYEVKLSDFGLYRVKPLDETVEDKNIYWKAPEVLNNSAPTKKSDVYSYGSVAYFMITSTIPNNEYKTKFDLVDAICTYRRKPEITDKTVPNSLKQLITDCWNEPDYRVPTQSIIRQLDNIIVDAAIPTDERAAQFWKRCFKEKTSVEWKLFVQNFCTELRLIQATSSSVNSNNSEELTLDKVFMFLHELLGENRTHDLPMGQVKLETFGRVVAWFGQIHQPTNNYTIHPFLDKIADCFRQPWFHGDISAKSSEQILADKMNKGTYLIRFSTSCLGAFTISNLVEVSPVRTVQHLRFLFDSERNEFVIKQNRYSTLKELVEGEKTNLQLLYPCLGSKYNALFAQDTNEGYVDPE